MNHGASRPGRAALARVAFALVVVFAAHPVRSQSPAPTPSAASAKKPAPTPAPTPHREAPTGIYYLTEDTVAPLKNGIRGIAAGTEVRLVKDNGGTVQVAEGDFEFTAKKTQVTNDLDLAEAIRKRAAAINAVNERAVQLQEEILIRQQREEIEFLRTHPLATPTPTPTPRGRR